MTDNKTTENVELAKIAADKAKKYTAAFEAEYSNEADAVTIKELLQKISELQNQLSGPLSSMGQLTGAIGAIVGEDDDDMNVRLKQIPEICNVFMAREKIFLKILDMYERIYDDIQKKANN